MTKIAYKAKPLIINLFSAFFLLVAPIVGADAQSIDHNGDKYFKARCYTRAVNEYLKFFAKSPSNKANPPLVKRIAEAVLLSEIKRDTAAYFADLYSELVPDDPEGYMLAARGYYHAHKFDLAKQRLAKYSDLATDEQSQMKADLLNSWISNSMRMLKDTLKNPLINLGELINSPDNEINPYSINDDKTLVFSCDDKFDQKAIINVYNVKFTEHSDLSWTNAKPVAGKLVNTLDDEYPSGPSPLGMFFCSNRDGDFALFHAYYKGNGRFDPVERFMDPIDLRGNEVGGCYSPTTDTLYFSGTTLNGDLDIFYSIMGPTGEWMEARPVPGLINQEGSDENYPYLSPDGKRMYFASDREGTMGGYDIFYSDYDEKAKEWRKPVQMPYPINDTYDNMTISFTRDGRYAYVSLIRDEGFGQRDIYAVLFSHIVPTSAILRYSVSVKGAQKEPLTQQPDIFITDRKGNTVAIERINPRTSSFIVVLDPGEYNMSVELEGTKPYTERIVVEERTYDPVPIERSIVLSPAQ